MSVLSAQCERLLALASNLKQTTRGHNECVTAMRKAAYTIWQLRTTNLDTANENDNLKVENEELREKGARLFDKTLELATENAKLRELVRDMRVCLEDECKRCHEWGDTCDLEQQMRELGVEVD